MARLASNIADLADHYSTVVIGSGYGGAIVAARIAKVHNDVCILERGKEFQPGDYPDTALSALGELQVDFPARHRFSPNGLYDLRVNEDISVIQGCGLGGGSLVNAGVALCPDRRVFTKDGRWPTGLRRDVYTRLAAAFDRAVRMHQPTTYPDNFPPLKKLGALDGMFPGLKQAYPGARLERLPINVNFRSLPNGRNHVDVEQQVCVGCGDCMSGCNFAAKTTLIMTYLPLARTWAAKIFTGIRVRRLEYRGEGTKRRWVVYYQLHDSGREQFHDSELFLTAERVVLAAGTLGSTEILLRSRGKSAPALHLSPKLGYGFTGNGDILAFGYNAIGEINAIGVGAGRPNPWVPVGPCATGMIDLRWSVADWREGMVIEDGTVAGALAGMMPAALLSAALLVGQPTDLDGPRSLGRDARGVGRQFGRTAAAHTFIFLIMGYDDAMGQIVLDPSEDRVRIRWRNADRQAFITRVAERASNASRLLGSMYVPNLSRLITAHPLGGCRMADSAAQGVVNDAGEVFLGDSGTDTYPGLYVADGSTIPCPLGVNPLLTISALAERMVELMLERWR